MRFLSCCLLLLLTQNAYGKSVIIGQRRKVVTAVTSPKGKLGMLCIIFLVSASFAHLISRSLHLVPITNMKYPIHVKYKDAMII